MVNLSNSSKVYDTSPKINNTFQSKKSNEITVSHPERYWTSSDENYDDNDYKDNEDAMETLVVCTLNPWHDDWWVSYVNKSSCVSSFNCIRYIKSSFQSYQWWWRGPARPHSRRNARRKEEFLMKKSQPSPEQEEVPSKELTSEISTFQCDQCEKVFKQDSGLKIHIGKTHKAPLSPANSLVTASELPSFQRGDPAEKLGCKHCDKLFVFEKELRLHTHEVHGSCRVGILRGTRFATPSPWPDCTTPWWDNIKWLDDNYPVG